MAPIIPGWSDAPAQLEEVAAACLEAGAVFVTPIALHLRRGVKEHFLAFVEEHHPERHAALARRYARSAYLSTPEQDVIARRVHGVVALERRRRSTADTFGHRATSVPATGSAGTAAPVPSPAEQLPLLPPT
jgi:DNA repair photolyase